MLLLIQHYVTSVSDSVIKWTKNHLDQLYLSAYLYIHISWFRCNTVLGEFLSSIKKDPSCVDFASMINIVIAHSQASDEMLQVIRTY
jgi:hypothetical protein